MYRKTVLANGVRVLTEAMPYVRSASIGIWADIGSAAERPEMRGISHLVEHMLFKGTERRSARVIAETMDGVGGNLNAFTDKETTCYYAKVIDHHVPLALDVLADMFCNSLFDPGELAKERSVVLDEIKMYDDSPEELIHDRFISTIWSGSNLGAPTIGFEETVSRFEREDLRAHMRAHYGTNAVVVTAAGNIDHDEFVALVARAFDGLQGAVDIPKPERPALTPVTTVEYKDTEQAYVIVGTRGLSLRDDDRYTLALLDTVFGGGMSSRLFQEIRESRGLAYSVYSFQQAYREAGLFAVYAGTSPENVQECVDVVLQQFDEVHASGVTASELALAKEQLKGSLTLSLESTSSRMIRLGRNEFSLERYVTVEEVEASIDAVTLDDVAGLAHELLPRRNIGMCVLGPLDSSAIYGPDRAVA